MENLDTKELWNDKDYAEFFGLAHTFSVTNRVKGMPNHPGRNTRDPVFSRPCFKRSELVAWAAQYHFWTKARCLFTPARLAQMTAAQKAEWGVLPENVEAANRQNRR